MRPFCHYCKNEIRRDQKYFNELIKGEYVDVCEDCRDMMNTPDVNYKPARTPKVPNFQKKTERKTKIKRHQVPPRQFIGYGFNGVPYVKLNTAIDYLPPEPLKAVLQQILTYALKTAKKHGIELDLNNKP